MTKIGKKLAAALLAVAMVVTFMPVLGSVTGGKIGVQTVHAKLINIYAPDINVQCNTIRLKIGNPYAGTLPRCIGSWEKVLDKDNGTKITVMDMWIDAENGPMDENSRFKEGKKYTYQAYIASATDSGSAPDISGWDLSVGKVKSKDDINWPEGSDVTCDKTEDKILYTAQFTAKVAPSRDKGTYVVDLSSGKMTVNNNEAFKWSYISMISEVWDSNYYKNGDEVGMDFDRVLDLDCDGTMDVGINIVDELNNSQYQLTKLSGASIKGSKTLSMSEEDKLSCNGYEMDYYGKMVFNFKKASVIKAANPLTIKPKTATVKYSKLKKKTQTLAVTKVIKFTKDAKDKKTYTLSSAKKGKKSFKKYFKIDKSTGKVTVKKGLKKGTYKVKVKVKALGNDKYKASAWKTVTFKVKVK